MPNPRTATTRKPAAPPSPLDAVLRRLAGSRDALVAGWAKALLRGEADRPASPTPTTDPGRAGPLPPEGRPR